MTIPPAAIGSSPAIARSTLVFPEPDAPMTVTLSPRPTANETPCTRPRAPRVTANGETSCTGTYASILVRAVSPALPEAGTAPDTSPRTSTGHEPAPDVRGEIDVCFVSSTTVITRNERAVFEQRDEIVGHRRQRQAKCLRTADEHERLTLAESKRARRVELAGGTASSALR